MGRGALFLTQRLSTTILLSMGTLVVASFAQADQACTDKMKRLAQSVPPSLMETLFEKVAAQHLDLTNPVAIVDFTKRSNQPRFFIVDFKKGTAEAHLTSHGTKSASRSDPTKAVEFSDDLNSGKSTLGLFRIGPSTRSPSLHRNVSHLEGLEPATKNASKRAICVQENPDVSDRNGKAGMTNGCFGIDPAIYSEKKNEFSGMMLLSGLDHPTEDPRLLDGVQLCALYEKVSVGAVTPGTKGEGALILNPGDADSAGP